MSNTAKHKSRSGASTNDANSARTSLGACPVPLSPRACTSRRTIPASVNLPTNDNDNDGVILLGGQVQAGQTRQVAHHVPRRCSLHRDGHHSAPADHVDAWGMCGPPTLHRGPQWDSPWPRNPTLKSRSIEWSGFGGAFIARASLKGTCRDAAWEHKVQRPCQRPRRGSPCTDGRDHRRLHSYWLRDSLGAPFSETQRAIHPLLLWRRPRPS